MKGYDAARAGPPPRVAEIIPPTKVCIAVRRILGVQTVTIVRYPVRETDWKYHLERVTL